MDDPEVYMTQPEVLLTNTRKNYVHDRMLGTLVYISEYAETRCMMTENKYRNENLTVRLRAILGHMDRIRDHNSPSTR